MPRTAPANAQAVSDEAGFMVLDRALESATQALGHARLVAESFGAVASCDRTCVTLRPRSLSMSQAPTRSLPAPASWLRACKLVGSKLPAPAPPCAPLSNGSEFPAEVRAPRFQGPPTQCAKGERNMSQTVRAAARAPSR